MSSIIDAMPLVPSWADIAFRILLTVVAGTLIGINREGGGHAAGFRTTVLVGLAACLTMIQANMLLSVSGKTGSSFAMMDILRFPLGVLTGVGFIGGGAILRRGSLVTGVTTAATLWVMTAIGLSIGGGQLILGSAGGIIAFIVLSPLKQLDECIPHRHKARLTIAAPAQSSIPDIEKLLGTHGCTSSIVACHETEGKMAFTFELQWKSPNRQPQFERLLQTLRPEVSVISFELISNVT